MFRHILKRKICIKMTLRTTYSNLNEITDYSKMDHMNRINTVLHTKVLNTQ